MHTCPVERVRIEDGEAFTDRPVQDLPILAVGGRYYAVYDRYCIEGDRMRVMLRPDEDPHEALRSMPGTLVRDIRVLLLVPDGTGGVPVGRVIDRFSVPAHDLVAGEVPVELVTARLDSRDVPPHAQQPGTAGPAPDARPAPDRATASPAELSGSGVVAIDREGRAKAPAWLQRNERPPCDVIEPAGSACGRPVQVVWTSPGGPGRSCAYHWPTSKPLTSQLWVLAAWDGNGAWLTEIATSRPSLVRAALARFYDSCLERGPRSMTWDEAKEVYDLIEAQLDGEPDLACLLWSILLTNPGLDADSSLVLLKHVMSEQAAGRGKPPSPQNLYDIANSPGFGGLVQPEQPVGGPDPTDGDGWYARSAEHFRAGDEPRARDALSHAVLDHGHGQSAFVLGTLAMKAGDTVTAVRWWEQGAALGDVRSMGMAGAHLAENGRLLEGLDLMKRAAALGNVTAEYNLGRTAALHKDFVNARLWLERARDHGDPDAVRLIERLPG
jgi:TPR repeat protein